MQPRFILVILFIINSHSFSLVLVFVNDFLPFQDYLKQLGVDECELSDDPGKFYVDVSLENNPEALLGRQE